MTMRKREISQWSGQFFAAGELARGGYRVSFSLGNAPSTDLTAVSAKGYQFKVEVKTVRRYGNSRLVKNVPRDSDLYYVLVVSRPKEDFPTPMFWILSAQEVKAILRKREQEGKSPQILKGDVSDTGPGWDMLPDYDRTVKLGT
ncbi:MAG: hypothetical protein ACE5IO_08875 [Thermoplasmata archaeon]